MTNNEITTINDIDLSVTINVINNNNADSINLNKNYTDLIVQSLNNIIELTNYKPSILYQFTTTNNESVNQTNKRRNIT